MKRKYFERYKKKKTHNDTSSNDNHSNFNSVYSSPYDYKLDLKITCSAEDNIESKNSSETKKSISFSKFIIILLFILY